MEGKCSPAIYKEQPNTVALVGLMNSPCSASSTDKQGTRSPCSPVRLAAMIHKHKMLIGSFIWGAPSFNSLLCIMPYAEDRRDEHQSKHHDMTSELVTKDFSVPLFPSTARATHCTLPLTYIQSLGKWNVDAQSLFHDRSTPCLSKTDAWTQQIQTTANITPEQQFTSAHLNFKQETSKPQRLLSITLSGLLCYKQLNVTRFRVNSQKLLMTHTDSMIHTPTINSRNAQS